MGGDEHSDRSKRSRADKSLLTRALGYLARREYSRVQLRRKLAPFADCAEEVELLLERLQQEKLLSDERFADVVARSRGERFGAARIAHELKRHGVEAELQRPILARLRQTELARAHALWQRKFGSRAASAAERARQMRYLSQRGFAGDVVRRVVEGRADD